jgi:hypothetical protein
VCFCLEEGKCRQDLVDKSEGKRPLGRANHRWDDIKMNNKALGLEDADLINLAEDRRSGGLLFHKTRRIF